MDRAPVYSIHSSNTQIITLPDLISEQILFCSEVENEPNQHQHSWILKTLFLGLLKWQSSARVSDRAVVQLILFLRAFLSLVADFLGYGLLRAVAVAIPRTIETVRERLNITRNDFLQFVACPKCHCLYTMEDVTAGVITRCIHAPWPNHTQRKYRKRCNKKLINFQTQVPKRVFAYKSISSYLQEFVQRPNFVTLCNQWRDRTVSNDYLSDIYDGELWKTRHHEYLTESSFNLLGMINVDWFAPYKHIQYSLGKYESSKVKSSHLVYRQCHKRIQFLVLI